MPRDWGATGLRSSDDLYTIGGRQSVAREQDQMARKRKAHKGPSYWDDAVWGDELVSARQNFWHDLYLRQWGSHTSINQIVPGLSTGGILATAEAAEEVEGAGITHVINCAVELDEGDFLRERGIGYTANGVDDDYRLKPTSWFRRTIDAALPVISAGGHVLIHCAGGINRGPSSAYAVLLAMGYKPTEANRLIREARPQVGLAYKWDAEQAIRAIRRTEGVNA